MNTFVASSTWDIARSVNNTMRDLQQVSRRCSICPNCYLPPEPEDAGLVPEFGVAFFSLLPGVFSSALCLMISSCFSFAFWAWRSLLQVAN